MKDEPEFKPLQGNPAFFQVSASRCPLHLRQKTQNPSHKPIAEGSLLLRCLWKVGLLLQSKPGNQLSPRDDMGCTELSSSCCAEIGVTLDLRRLSQGISVSIPPEGANSGFLEHTYCRGKPPLEVLVESLPTSSIESWESPLFSIWGAWSFLEFLC